MMKFKICETKESCSGYRIYRIIRGYFTTGMGGFRSGVTPNRENGEKF